MTVLLNPGLGHWNKIDLFSSMVYVSSHTLYLSGLGQITSFFVAIFHCKVEIMPPTLQSCCRLINICRTPRAPFYICGFHESEITILSHSKWSLKKCPSPGRCRENVLFWEVLRSSPVFWRVSFPPLFFFCCLWYFLTFIHTGISRLRKAKVYLCIAWSLIQLPIS